jgi:hypothetical protein
MSDENIAQRVSTLLSHYDENSDDHRGGLQRALACDWETALAGIPIEVVAEASRWWVSRHNADRDNVPMPEDILARAGAIMRGKGVV